MKVVAVDLAAIKELEGTLPAAVAVEACGPAHCVLIDKEAGQDSVQASNGWRVGDAVYFFTPPNPTQSGMWSVCHGLEVADVYLCDI